MGKKKKILKISIILSGILVLICGAAIGALLYTASQNLPSVDFLKQYTPSLVTRIYSDDAEILDEFFIEKRVLVPLEDIPLYLREAVVAVEDSRFYRHHGIDYRGILRAFWINLKHMKIKQGGSTITQQLARSLFLSPRQNIMRKLKEAILARRIEKVLSKDKILELYLNQIYFGRGAYGVQAAANTYFGKDVKDLNLAECALLAGLIRSPAEYSPYKHPERAKLRQKVVLKRMHEEGYITEIEYKRAYSKDLYLRKPERHKKIAPYFVEYIRQYLISRYGVEKVYNGGLQVYTTLDTYLQKAANITLREGLRVLDKRRGYRGPIGHKSRRDIDEWLRGEKGSLTQREILPGDILQGIVTHVEPYKAEVRVGGIKGILPLENMLWARRRLKGGKVYFRSDATVKDILSPGDIILVKVVDIDRRKNVVLSLEQEPLVEGALVSLDPITGYVKAMVGGYDFERSQFNRAIQARRQPGSAFKPFVYGAAIDAGFTPATMLDDSPVSYEIPGWKKNWTPENYDGKFYGPITLRDGLVYSRNVVTIKLAEQIGIGNVINFARKLGIKSKLNRNLSLALGSSGVSLLELTSAYGVFANHGIRINPIFIKYITDREGHVLESHVPVARRVLSEQTAYITTNILQDVIQRGTGRRARVLGKPLAGKTGTTNRFTDAWFVGYAPNLVAGVWVGFDDMKSLGYGEAGSRAALPIWIKYMKMAIDHIPDMGFPIPDGIVFVKIDPRNGLLAPPDMKDFVVEIFKKGTEPTEVSPLEDVQPARYIEQDTQVD